MKDPYLRWALGLTAVVAAVSLAVVPAELDTTRNMLPSDVAWQVYLVAMVWVVCLTARALARRKVRR